MSDETTDDLSLAGIPIRIASSAQRSMSILLWGKSGVGKTTLAATAPGKKLWLNFDNKGTASIAGRPDVFVMDLSQARAEIVTNFKNEDPFGLSTFITKNKFDTIVVDSLTSYAELAIQFAISGPNKAAGAIFENPGPGGYGQRNRFTLGIARHMLRTAESVGIHIIFICHEDVPLRDKDNNIVGTTILLGGSLSEEIPLKLSEVWHLRDTGIKKLITVRSGPIYKPMKTRMFEAKATEFEWVFDPDKWEGMRIEEWYEAWKHNNHQKIPAPRAKPKT